MIRKNFSVYMIAMIIFFVQVINSDNSKETEIKDLAGTWTGYGASSEVRFRHKLGLLTLTVKHKTEFVFVVDKNGKIDGEGSITYDLEKNTSGLDDLVASVHSLMAMAKVPGTGSAIADKMGEGVRNVKGVTQIQYDAPHLKNGPELRHFKFKGKINKGKVMNRFGKFTESLYIEIEEVKDFNLIGGKPDNVLIAEYEVNKVKTEAKFPCWSPFINGPGVVRKGPGKVHIAEFQRKGEHRNNKNVWQEYSYVWLARQVNPESE